LKLIIATPSPYARKARVALLEKNISFEIIIDNPWAPATGITKINPLGKVPALILDDGEVFHDSSVIVEYLETLPHFPRLIPQQPAPRVAVKQIEAVADGVCDAVVLSLLEHNRKPEQQNAAWISRQRRKIEAGVAELSRRLGARDFFTDGGFSRAEIATVCCLGYLDLRFPEFDWRAGNGNLERLFIATSMRPSFMQSVPTRQVVPQEL